MHLRLRLRPRQSSAPPLDAWHSSLQRHLPGCAWSPRRQQALRRRHRLLPRHAAQAPPPAHPREPRQQRPMLPLPQPLQASVQAAAWRHRWPRQPAFCLACSAPAGLRACEAAPPPGARSLQPSTRSGGALARARPARRTSRTVLRREVQRRCALGRLALRLGAPGEQRTRRVEVPLLAREVQRCGSDGRVSSQRRAARALPARLSRRLSPPLRRWRQTQAGASPRPCGPPTPPCAAACASSCPSSSRPRPSRARASAQRRRLSAQPRAVPWRC